MAADPDDFITALLDVNAPLAGRCAGAGDAALSTESRARVAETLRRRRVDQEADLRARIEAALRLGEVGDPSYESEDGPFGRYLLAPMISVLVEECTIGRDDQPIGEALLRQHVELAAFSLGQYPVTNAEFGCFIDSGGYDDDRWWVTDAAKAWHRGEGTGEPARLREWHFYSWFHSDPNVLDEFHGAGYVTQPFYERWQRWLTLNPSEFRTEVEALYPDRPIRLPDRWGDDGFNAASQPVIGVSYYEAMAYCAWLNASSRLAFRLPSEVEWEVAARGPEQRRYAWGDAFDIDRCNSVETHLRRTTPVGVFPLGGTPEGIFDMTGNVFEWTNSMYTITDHESQKDVHVSDHVPTKSSASHALKRVIRGGSWGQDQHQVQAWRRLGELPAAYGDNQGFRLALSET